MIQQPFRSAVIALAIFIAVAGCKDDEENYIDGSLVKNYNISYDSMQSRCRSSLLWNRYKYRDR